MRPRPDKSAAALDKEKVEARRLTLLSNLTLAAYRDEPKIDGFFDVHLQGYSLNEDDISSVGSGNTFLIEGISNTSIHFLNKLLDKPFTRHVNVSCTGFTHCTPLILCVSKGWKHIDSGSQLEDRPPTLSEIAIRLVLEKNADVNGRDKYGRTALHYACLHRDIEAVQFLVAHGGLWNTPDKDGLTPFDFIFYDVNRASEILRHVNGGRFFTLNKDNFESGFDLGGLLHALHPGLENKKSRIENYLSRYLAKSEMRDSLTSLHDYLQEQAGLYKIDLSSFYKDSFLEEQLDEQRIRSLYRVYEKLMAVACQVTLSPEEAKKIWNQIIIDSQRSLFLGAVGKAMIGNSCNIHHIAMPESVSDFDQLFWTSHLPATYKTLHEIADRLLEEKESLSGIQFNHDNRERFDKLFYACDENAPCLLNFLLENEKYYHLIEPLMCACSPEIIESIFMNKLQQEKFLCFYSKNRLIVLAGVLEAHETLFDNKDVIRFLLHETMKSIEGGHTTKAFQDVVCFLSSIDAVSSVGAYLKQYLPSMLKSVIKYGNTSDKDHDMQHFLQAINDILWRCAGENEEKMTEKTCYPHLLFVLKNPDILNGCVDFIETLPIAEIQFLLDDKTNGMQLDIINQMSPSPQKWLFLQPFFDKTNGKFAFVKTFLPSKQKQILTNAIDSLLSDDESKNTCFRSLKEYIGTTESPERLSAVFQAIYLLASKTDVRSDLAALSKSVQESHTRRVFQTHPLSEILNTYMKNMPVSAFERTIRPEQ